MKLGTPPNEPSGVAAAVARASSNVLVAIALIFGLTASARAMAASVASSEVVSPWLISSARRVPSIHFVSLGAALVVFAPVRRQ